MDNKPVQVWEKGKFRIVALDADEYSYEPRLILEERCEDALGKDAWFTIKANDEEMNSVLQTLLIEIAQRSEVVPKWVREYMAKEPA